MMAYKIHTDQIILFQAMVSLRRLGKYLCSDELKADNVSRAPLSAGKNPTHE